MPVDRKSLELMMAAMTMQELVETYEQDSRKRKRIKTALDDVIEMINSTSNNG